MPSIRNNNGRPDPRQNKRPPPGGGKTVPIKDRPMVERLRAARDFAGKDKSVKYIVKKTGLDKEEVRAIVAAAKGLELRRSHRDLLKRNLSKLRGLMPIAEETYASSPSGYNAGAINTLSCEIRALISDIEDLQRPETQALEIIQSIFQPFISKAMRESVLELRRARDQCVAVAESPEAEAAIRKAFASLGRALGTVFKDAYAEHAEKLGILLQCDLGELRKVARGDSDLFDEMASDSNKVRAIGSRR